MQTNCTRRDFLRAAGAFALGAPLLPFRAESAEARRASNLGRASATVAIARCRSYGLAEVRAAMEKMFDELGGLGALVRNKTVAVKINLTGTNFTPFLDRPAGETFMTHEATARALTALLFAAGAKRVRLLESTQSRAELEATLDLADWDVRALQSLGKVEFENTRNLGRGQRYAHLKAPGAGYLFSSFDLNHSYADADVMVSLCKLKNHVTAGVTLSMKNLFGITPNSLYGDQAGSEEATAGRGPLHNRADQIKLPGLKAGVESNDATWRVPRIIVDICAARPIHLAIIDGITAMSGGEGPWCGRVAKLKFTSPGILIAGLNPVSTDAIGAAAMGCSNPRAASGVKPFDFCSNHLLLAEQAGLGAADLSQIDLRGLPLAQARYPYGS